MNNSEQGMTPDNIEGHLNAFRDGYNAAMPPTVNPSGLQDEKDIIRKFIRYVSENEYFHVRSTYGEFWYKNGRKDTPSTEEFIKEYLQLLPTPPSQALGIDESKIKKLSNEVHLNKYHDISTGEFDEGFLEGFKAGYAASQSNIEEEKESWGETISFFLEACAANVGDKIYEKVVDELQSKFKISKR